MKITTRNGQEVSLVMYLLCFLLAIIILPCAFILGVLKVIIAHA